MSTRKQKINFLKEHLNKMQSELKAIQVVEKGVSPKWQLISKLNEIKMSRQSLQSKRNNSNNKSRQEHSLSQRKQLKGYCTVRNRQRSQMEDGFFETLRDISNKIDSQYYRKKKNQHRGRGIVERDTFNNTSYVGQRYRYTNYRAEGMENSKSSKIKTYSVKPTDTILNPQKESARQGVKIVKKIQKSPNSMLSDNPKSSTKLYFFTDRAILVDRKSHIEDKNKSSLALSSSTQFMIPIKAASSQEKSIQSQKRHFGRHNELLYRTLI